MKGVSLIIPCYNEIRFIQKTLESVIGEADEIILSDNASTDGTSDICQEYASKYPEIKYTRHTENIGIANNSYFAFNKVSGKYMKQMGGHDMLARGSSQSMFDLLETHKDAAMVFHKYTINLNPDYSFKSFHCHDEFSNDLSCDSPFLRVKSMIKNICDFSIAFGLVRTNLYKHIMSRKNIFQYGITDHTQMAELAKAGKILIDDKSIFFRMNPHDKNETVFEQGERINKNLYPNQNYHPLFWTFAFISEQYYLAKEMQSLPDAPKNYSDGILNILLDKYWVYNVTLSLDKMPPPVSGQEGFCKELLNSIFNYQEKTIEKEKAIKTRKITTLIRIIIVLKKIIKNLLPYYIVKRYKRRYI
jgi:glycosyltransferase involved in cell wall biosynthesis